MDDRFTSGKWEDWILQFLLFGIVIALPLSFVVRMTLGCLLPKKSGSHVFGIEIVATTEVLNILQILTYCNAALLL